MEEVARAKWNRRYESEELVWSVGPNALFSDLISQYPEGTALDAGCGEGRNAIWLAEQGWNVTAVDFADAGISKGRQIADKRGVDVCWHVADICEFAAEGFDLVAALYLHTSRSERVQWLSRLQEFVNPGGLFFYLGHDPTNIAEGVGGPQDPDVLPDVSEVVAHLGSFRVLRSETVRRTVASETGHSGGEGHALDALVMAVKAI